MSSDRHSLEWEVIHYELHCISCVVETIPLVCTPEPSMLHYRLVLSETGVQGVDVSEPNPRRIRTGLTPLDSGTGKRIPHNSQLRTGRLSPATARIL